ncbi:hypothetical protein [Streptomyces sp. M2CJ-2]|nr:hypothetical protein [Streptomyces sp. M2CJ-2]
MPLHVKTDDPLNDSPHLAPWRPRVGIIDLGSQWGRNECVTKVGIAE